MLVTALPALLDRDAVLVTRRRSLVPTSIGANPPLAIYAVAARVAEGVATTLRT